MRHKQSIREDGGFSLIEVMAASIILGLISLTLISLSQLVTNTQINSQLRTSASLASEAIDTTFRQQSSSEQSFLSAVQTISPGERLSTWKLQQALPIQNNVDNHIYIAIVIAGPNPVNPFIPDPVTSLPNPIIPTGDLSTTVYDTFQVDNSKLLYQSLITLYWRPGL